MPASTRGQRREGLAPGEAEYRECGSNRPDERYCFPPIYQQSRRKGEREGQRQRGPGRNAEGRRFGQRVAHHLLEDRAGQRQCRACEERDHEPRQEAVLDQQLPCIVEIGIPQNLSPQPDRELR